MASTKPFEGTLILYTYFRSSCSCRIRTACQLKGIDLTYRYVNLLKGEQRGPDYLDNVNPGGTVPTLVVQDGAGHTLVTVTQSIAILEFLEEFFPQTKPLLPAAGQAVQRAKVRELVNIIANDVQPPTNLRVLRRVNGLGVKNEEWCAEFMAYGLSAYERVLRETAGVYSVGDEVSLADVVLAPAIENAMRWGVDLSSMPQIQKVFGTLAELPAFRSADWRHQEDTPEGLRTA